MTTELGDFPRRRPTIPRLDFRPLAQLPPALRAPRAAPGPRTAPVAALDFDALQFDAFFLVAVVEGNVARLIATNARHFSGIPLALSFIIRIDLIALFRNLRALRTAAAAPRARAASRTGPLLDVALLDVALLLAVVVCVGKMREQ